MPPSRLVDLDHSSTVEQLHDPSLMLSARLSEIYPLHSAALKDLAAVSCLGAQASSGQRALRAVDLVEEIANDGALQYSAYSTASEDFASLYETVMMGYHYGLSKDVALTEVSPFSDGNQVVVWGQYNRLGDQNVVQRALTVIQAMYPENLAEMEAYIVSGPVPMNMQEGATWMHNESPSSVSANDTDTSVIQSIPIH